MTSDNKLDPATMAQFTGSETFYRFDLRGDVLITEGVKYVADTVGAYWLLDAICIANAYETKIRAEDFQLWVLSVNEDSTATLTCDDGNGKVVYQQTLDFPDFPHPGIKLYFYNAMISLRSEYALRAVSFSA